MKKKLAGKPQVKYRARVPKAPPKAARIEERDKKRIGDWIAYFEALSPTRIHVFKGNNKSLPGLLAEAEERERETRHIDRQLYKLSGWPPPRQEIAFAVFPSFSPATEGPKFDPRDIYVFCLGNRAFPVHYFQWDGDSETGHDPGTFSLRSYTESALSWQYVSGLIVRYIKEAVAQVPPLT